MLPSMVAQLTMGDLTSLRFFAGWIVVSVLTAFGAVCFLARKDFKGESYTKEVADSLLIVAFIFVICSGIIAFAWRLMVL